MTSMRMMRRKALLSVALAGVEWQRELKSDGSWVLNHPIGLKCRSIKRIRKSEATTTTHASTRCLPLSSHPSRFQKGAHCLAAVLSRYLLIFTPAGTVSQFHSQLQFSWFHHRTFDAFYSLWLPPQKDPLEGPPPKRPNLERLSPPSLHLPIFRRSSLPPPPIITFLFPPLHKTPALASTLDLPLSRDHGIVRILHKSPSPCAASNRQSPIAAGSMCPASSKLQL